MPPPLTIILRHSEFIYIFGVVHISSRRLRWTSSTRLFTTIVTTSQQEDIVATSRQENLIYYFLFRDYFYKYSSIFSFSLFHYYIFPVITMAEAIPSVDPIVEVSLDLDLLATQSDFYRALVDFHGIDAINVLAYPIGSPFSKQCFLAVLHNLGSKEEFSTTLSMFPIGELFKVALYLGSETLLYHVVFDTLKAATAVTILDLAIDILGLDHYITDTVIQFIHIITHDSRDKIINLMQNSKTKLGQRIKNNIKSSGEIVTDCIRKQLISEEFMVPFKTPDVCLCCKLPITGLHSKNLSARLAPMGCCGMMVHLQCQLKFLAKPG